MKIVANQVFSKADAVLEEGLNQRLKRQDVIASNLVNAYTPGYRALGYEFENQLQSAIGSEDGLPLKTTDAKHIKQPGLSADGNIKGDLHVKPSESIGNDGNSVDVDKEMSDMAANQLIYRATIETMNRRLGMMRYGINGGR
jgi:flagellar basal-body rod protein FlgB